jgi:hypothetical protein
MQSKGAGPLLASWLPLWGIDQNEKRNIFSLKKYVLLLILRSCGLTRPPLWPSGQISRLQIQRPGFNSRRYQIF